MWHWKKGPKPQIQQVDPRQRIVAFFFFFTSSLAQESTDWKRFFSVGQGQNTGHSLAGRG